jgi:hypothetical protein
MPVGVPAQPAAQKSKLPVVLLIGAVLLLVCVAGAVVVARLILDRVQPPVASVTPEPTRILSRNGSADVAFEGGTVILKGGPEVEIPSGAIPTGPGGSSRSISVQISKSDETINLPAGMQTVGDVYDIGPEGVTFETPVRISLPIPADADPADLVGLATLDAESGEWTIAPSSVDPGAGMVTAYVTHFSPWGMIGGRAEAAKWGGWIRITNAHIRGSSPFPGCRHLPLTLENGVCFLAYTPQTPANLLRPWRNMILAKDQTTTEYWLPSGTYTLEDWKFASEINNDPTYGPCVKWWTRPVQTIVMKPGLVIEFGDSTYPPPSNYSEIPNRCAPVPRPTLTPGPTPTPGPTLTPSTTVTLTPEGEEEMFEVMSFDIAYKGATAPTTFRITESWLVTEIGTYHWNDGNGAEPGTISLRADDGTTYGPWPASGMEGQGGVPNANWIVKPNVVIPAGTYTVIDSDPATWAQNDQTGGAGMAWGKGVPQK